MSDVTNAIEDAIEAPVEGQAEVEVGLGDAIEAARNYLALDENADSYVKLNVAGEEVEVPLQEALSGYQRQADYTRKTQELSEQRKQVQFGASLQEALQNDPANTIELLKQHYGLDRQQASNEEELLLDPVEKQFQQYESRIQAMEKAKAVDDLNRTVDFLSKKYGQDFDADQVISRALATGNANLESVYKQVAFDKMFEQKIVTNQVKDKLAGDTQRIVQAKRQAAVVSSGSSAKSADTTLTPVNSISEAYQLAKIQLAG